MSGLASRALLLARCLGNAAPSSYERLKPAIREIQRACGLVPSGLYNAATRLALLMLGVDPRDAPRPYANTPPEVPRIPDAPQKAARGAG